MPIPVALAGLLARIAVQIGGRQALRAGLGAAARAGASNLGKRAMARAAAKTAGAAATANPGLLKRTGQAFASGFHPTTIASQVGPMALFMAPWLLAGGGGEGEQSPFDDMASAEQPRRRNLYS